LLNQCSPSNDNALGLHCSLADVDRHVSARIRSRRILLGLTVQQLAELIGVTWQQAYKYENGINRISAGRLHRIAAALEVDVAFFFSGPAMSGEFMPSDQQRALFELTHNVARISCREQQELVCALARTMAGGPP
jgi:transcriptional regulator with XRE-family HTH domain